MSNQGKRSVWFWVFGVVVPVASFAWYIGSLIWFRELAGYSYAGLGVLASIGSVIRFEQEDKRNLVSGNFFLVPALMASFGLPKDDTFSMTLWSIGVLPIALAAIYIYWVRYGIEKVIRKGDIQRDQ
ncbi:MAG: hypothetical protein R2688_10045 [Fimbriimonadaceae bacterium]